MRMLLSFAPLMQRPSGHYQGLHLAGRIVFRVEFA